MVAANGLKITCAKFGVKKVVRVRDTATKVMYCVMGKSSSFLRRMAYDGKL